MAEQASHVSREAKGLQQGLKEALKNREPWDKEIEFQRKNLRRQYLRLLLVYPYAKESKDAETHLWMQTSYAFISIYKQRITQLDRTLQSAQRHQTPQGGHGPVEYRKLMQRFRQFLAEEEKFWTQLVVRLRRSFGLDEAQAAFIALGISPAEEPNTPANVTEVEKSPQRDETASNGRNHFQFPVEDSSPTLPQTPVEREGRLAILSKALVCLGDIARYRELYNESGGRPKAGHDESAAKKHTRTKRRGGTAGIDVPLRARNYEKAQQCYEQARLLVPYEGNPSHQLAILASYQKDAFGSLVHYYRALCVMQPYDTASENLGTVLNKALDQWKGKIRREKEKNNGQAVERDPSSFLPRVRVEVLKEKVVVLHALWRLGVDRMESTSPKHAESVLEDFKSLVSERVLPIDLISKVIVLSQGALWKHRTIRDSTSPVSNTSPSTIESHIATHVLGLHRVLLENGIIQLSESPPHDASESDLAQRITAIFRRTLPALRIAGKWLRANIKYVLQGRPPNAEGDREDTEQGRKKRGPSVLISGLPAFWETYAEFNNALYRCFPADKLPTLVMPLEEDIDMSGFLPLKKLMVGENAGGDRKGEHGQTAQFHPNVEQLMRIADLLQDSKVIINQEDSPLLMQPNSFVAAPGHPAVQSPRVIVRGRQIRTASIIVETLPKTTSLRTVADTRPFEPVEREDDAMTETSRDDPVGDAFRQVLDASDEDMEDEEQEDEIVWNPRASPVSPKTPAALPPRTITMSPTAPTFTPRSPVMRTPTRPPPISPFIAPSKVPVAVNSTTAEDLLNNVLRLPRIQPGTDVGLKSTAPQPQLLFGSGPPNLPGHSIWSMSLDNNSKGFANMSQAPRPYESPRQPLSKSPQALSPSAWPSSFAESNQESQNHFPGALPTGFNPHPHDIAVGSHRRVPSANLFSEPSPRNEFYSSAQSYYHPRGPTLHSPSTYADPALMGAGQSSFYPESSISNYRNQPFQNDPMIDQVYASSVPQLWGNVG